MKQYDIFISYKRKSLAAANNLYYRLTMKGYSTFFDLEEMGRDNFNVQLFSYIENAKDFFVLLEEGSLDGCKKENDKWKNDWFCLEIEHALKTHRNIIPIFLSGFTMPDKDFFPEELKDFSYKNAPEFSFSFFDEYLNKLIEKGYITSSVRNNLLSTSFFKFYSDENCDIYQDGKHVCSIVSMADEPYYLPINRKGDYRFKCVFASKSVKTMIASIDDNEEKIIHIMRMRKRNKKYVLTCFLLLILLVFNLICIYIVTTKNNESEGVIESIYKKKTNNVIVTDLFEN